MKQAARNQTSTSQSLARDLPKLIADAQRQPGLRQVLELVEQGQEAMRPLRELASSSPFTAGVTLGSTSLPAGQRR
jgi:hypothetical protein